MNVIEELKTELEACVRDVDTTFATMPTDDISDYERLLFGKMKELCKGVAKNAFAKGAGAATLIFKKRLENSSRDKEQG